MNSNSELLPKECLLISLLKKAEKNKSVQTDLFSSFDETAEEKEEDRKKVMEDLDVNYQLVDSQEARTKLIHTLSSANSFCFDTETTGLDPSKAELIGMPLQ